MVTVVKKQSAIFGAIIQTAGGAGAKEQSAAGSHMYLLREKSVF
jgi:hypothetical protein